MTNLGATVASILGALYVWIHHLPISLSNGPSYHLNPLHSTPSSFSHPSTPTTALQNTRLSFGDTTSWLMTSKSIATESYGQRSGSENSYVLTLTLCIRPLPMYEQGCGASSRVSSAGAGRWGATTRRRKFFAHMTLDNA